MSRHDLRTGVQKNIRPTVGRGGAATGPAAPTANEINRAEHPPAGQLPEAAAETAAQGGGRGFGGRGGPPNVINAPPNVAPFRFYWNAPFEISPHNPASGLHGGAVLFQIHQPRRYVVDESNGFDRRT